MAPKTKTAASTNGASKGKSTPVPSTDGTTTPVSVTDRKDTSEGSIAAAFAASGGKPDKKAYDAENERIKSEIEAVNVTLSALREKIGLTSKGASNERRTALRAELEEIKSRQAGSKASRTEIQNQVKALDEQVQKKIKDLNVQRSKVPFKTVADVDAHIKHLEKQIDSGTMKVVDEKRAISDITQSKRQRRTVESFQAEEESITVLRGKISDLRKQQDDPEFKALHDRFDSVKAELDELRAEADEVYKSRSSLFQERDAIQIKLDGLHTERRELSRQFKDANDRYWNKVHEDRARRMERAKAQRAAEEAQKRQEIAERLLEEARIPAYQAQIEDCQTLIDSFSGRTTGKLAFKSIPSLEKADVAGVPKLEIRKVDETPLEGLVARKKKGDDEESYFVGGKGKSKGKKGGKSNASTEPSTPTSGSLNVPLPTLSALLSLSIPPPTSPADVPRVVDNLKTKKEWYEANQARVTAENVAKAEAEIKRLTNASNNDDKVDASDVTPPNGDAEIPPEPPAVDDAASTTVSGDEVAEVVEEQETAAS